MLKSWYFGAGGDILGQKHAFLTEKCEKLELHYKTVEIHQWVEILRGSHPNMSLIKRDAIINEKVYL